MIKKEHPSGDTRMEINCCFLSEHAAVKHDHGLWPLDDVLNCGLFTYFESHPFMIVFFQANCLIKMMHKQESLALVQRISLKWSIYHNYIRLYHYSMQHHGGESILHISFMWYNHYDCETIRRMNKTTFRDAFLLSSKSCLSSLLLLTFLLFLVHSIMASRRFAGLMLALMLRDAEKYFHRKKHNNLY